MADQLNTREKLLATVQRAVGAARQTTPVPVYRSTLERILAERIEELRQQIEDEKAFAKHSPVKYALIYGPTTRVKEETIARWEERRGRELRGVRRVAGHRRGAQISQRARADDACLVILLRRYDMSDELQFQFRTAATYVKARMPMKNLRTIQRRIKALMPIPPRQ